MYTFHDNGLMMPWEGRVWLNPPYGPHIGAWMERLAHHGNGIALIFGRTDTEMFHRTVFARADAILFVKGRITFFRPDGSRGNFTGGAPSVLIAYGAENVRALECCGVKGSLVMLGGQPSRQPIT